MYYYKNQNAAGSKITVTATATNIYDLINTAASTTAVNAGFPSDTNAIDISVEDGDIRILFDGNTPTGTNGFLLSSGNTYYFRGVPIGKMKLIRITGNVVCSVQLGKSAEGESTNSAAHAVTIEGSIIASSASVIVDDAAFTPATSSVDVIGAFADETATDSVDEGDVGALRMTLNRRLITADNYAIDSVAGATDYGSAILAKHKEDQVHITSADGDYNVPTLDSLGSLHVNAEAHHVFDTFNATTDWSVLNNDAANLATTTKHVTGTNALTFDKVDGAANTVFAAIQKTLSSVDLGAISPHDLLQGTFYIPDLTNVAYVFLRLGTDSSNYNEWRLPDTALTAATFLTGAQSIGDANYAGITGNGWNPAAITYICVGVAFDSEANTLAGLVFDEVSYHTNQHTSASFSAEITSDVNTPNINLNRVGGVATATNAGTLSNGTLRVTIATDDEVNNLLGTIDSDTSILQAAVKVDDAAFTPATSSVMMLGALADQTATDAVDEGDAGVVGMTLLRELKTQDASLRGVTNAAAPKIDSYSHIAINVAAGAADTVLVASAANKQIWVYGYEFSTDIAGTISIQDEDNTAVTGIMTFGIGGGAVVAPNGNFSMPIWKLGTDKDLEVDTVTCTLDGWLAYAIVDVS